jgi:hypothetical protein
MESLYIMGMVAVIVGGTFCFAALQWPQLFNSAWRVPAQLDLARAARRLP